MMPNFSHPTFRKVLSWGAITLGATLVCVLIVAGSAYGYAFAYQGKIYPGVIVFDQDLGGKTRAEAELWITNAIQAKTPKQVSFTIAQGTIDIPMEANALQYQVDQLVEDAYQLGRQSTNGKNAFAQLELRLRPRVLEPVIELNTASLEVALKQSTGTFVRSVKDATFVTTMNGKTPIVTIDPEHIGQSVEIDRALQALHEQARRLTFRPIPLSITTIRPNWTEQDLQPLQPKLLELLARAPFALTYETERWNVTAQQLSEWITPVRILEATTVGLDEDRVSTTLVRWLGPELQTATTGTFVYDENTKRATGLVIPRDGRVLSTTGTIENIYQGWENNSSTISIDIQVDPGRFIGADPERLGVLESLGTGRSNFSGSPSNRRKNISLGAAKINGTLIAPGGEFSLLKALGEIDGENGWLPELVIKGDKTVPEFGGGLCQVGTTVFRATLSAGLPITERRNHSYRVRYYEPAGTDATIYDPAPDYRFKNDTSSTIMLLTKVQGDNLVFSFWGTNDGRIATQTTPRVYNIVPPPPKKLIESTEIPVGTTKCTEVAHAGADASFDYSVTYANGETKKTNFFSHYRPWGAVCLVGVAQLSSTSTPMIDETGINNPN